MKVTIEPGILNGTISAPPSKSMTQRVLAAALLHKGRTIVKNAGSSADEQAALHIIQQLGAVVQTAPNNDFIITSSGINPSGTLIDCGESGLSARLFIPIASLSAATITIQGHGSLVTRPMAAFQQVLPECGVVVQSPNGVLPITVRGPFQPTSDLTIDGSESSQFISGLLFALCCSQSSPLHSVYVRDLVSRPYVLLSLHVLRLFGNEAREREPNVFTAWQPTSSPGEIQVKIDGDWSSAAFFMVAGAIAGDVTIRGLNNNNLQADSAIYQLLVDAGANVSLDGDAVRICRSFTKGFEFDATHCPDLFPILAVLAACSSGESYITGVHRLFHKESNRAQSISEMLENFNVPFSIEDDAFCISGVHKLQGTVIEAHNDHRIVMAAAIAALRASGPVEIAGAEAINKSYPDFFRDLQLCGGKCTFNIG